MARTQRMRLNRRQLRALRNPLPSEGARLVTVTPEQTAQAESILRGIVLTNDMPGAVTLAFRKWLRQEGKKAPFFLALQGNPMAVRSHPAFQIPVEDLALKLLGLEPGDPVRTAYPSALGNAEVMDALGQLMDVIAQGRVAAEAELAGMQAAADAQIQGGRARAAQTASTESVSVSPDERKIVDEAIGRGGVKPLSQNKLVDLVKFGGLTQDGLRYLSQSLKDLTSPQGWKDGKATKKASENTKKKIRKAINEALASAPSSAAPAPAPSRVRAQVEPEAADEAREEIDPGAFDEMMAALGGSGGGDDESSDDDDEEDGGTAPGDPLPRGAGSEAWDPYAMTKGQNALIKSINASEQRSQARAARIGAEGKLLLPFRRRQSRNRSGDSNAPVIFSPPEDVVEKIEEIMDGPDYREGRPALPTQFQDVLVYILTSDHPVDDLGRRIVPAGSVEVYNKGTLVGTFGKSTYGRNLAAAMRYAGTLVGADIREKKFKAHKQSRMHSRVLMAVEGQDGWRLIVPALSQIIRGQTPESIEREMSITLDDASRADFTANPRRQPVGMIGRTRYVATRNGYRVLNGRHSGRTYTVNQYGHGCKLAMLLDLME